MTDTIVEGAVAAPPEPTFADFDVHPDIVDALAGLGIVHPFPIQAMTLPVALGGHDIIGQAKTGTGKTLGFGIPILQRVVSPTDEGYASLARPGKPQALAVTPTRELAVQVASDLERAGARRGIRVLTVYGGRAYEPQIEALRTGVEVVVGTPGRLIDLAKQGHLDLSQAKIVVLDEADEMLDLGFLPDVETLMAQTPATRQTMLFSATMPGAIVALARRYMRQPTHIRAMGDDTENAHTVKAIEQFVYRAHALDKVEMLTRILQARDRGLTLVFSRTKRTAAKVAEDLAERGFAAAAIHGDLGQGAREQALRAFRSGKVDVLVATDVAARGIDVEHVTHVVNYQCPEDEKTYVHRVGRTARAGNTGIAVTFVDWDDMPRWGLINRQLDLGMPDPEETYSSSDHLYAQLDIPTDVTGRLDRAHQTRAGLGAEVLEDLGETGKSSGRRPQDDRPRGDRPRSDRPRGDRQQSDRQQSDRPRSDRPRGERRTDDRHPGDTAGPDGGGRSNRSRQRRRVTHDVAESASPQATSSDPATSSDSAQTSGNADAGASRPRRRRRRGGSGSGADSGGDSGSSAASTES
ncbi:DEAD/DEAH box helicase [Lapillicoccus sp.]|uniref:DEAD/DEAH box helicase n=1 Tax=Lapillicoccus sp. TaxID=1909287 RepID=UPI00326321FE